MTSIGMNLAPVNYWTAEDPFIDRFKTAGSWVGQDSANATVPISVDANGYPINLPSNVTQLAIGVGLDPQQASTSDEYVLTYSGTASVRIAGATIVSTAPGQVVFDLKANNSSVSVYFTGFSSTTPLSNVHIVRADQQSLFNAGEIFNPDFVAKVSQWQVIRFMDWSNTNASSSVTWDTRTHLTNASWSYSTADGVPVEAMVQLANEAHTNIWYNVPTKADDTYVTNALTYIKDHLDPGLKVYVEYSNEVWNTSFAAAKYASDQATALWGTTSSANNVYYGYRSAQIASIAHTVFGSSADARLVDVLSGQNGNPSLLTNYILAGVAKAGLGTAQILFKDYAVAPYFGGELSTAANNAADHATILGWATSGAAGLDAAFHELEFGGSLSSNSSLTASMVYLASVHTAAAAAGLDLITYEAGVSLLTYFYPASERPEIQAFFDNLVADPRMGELYTKMIAELAQNGADLLTAYNDVGSNSQWGDWGALTTIYDDGSARYDALAAAAAAASAATHTVTSTIGTALTALAVGGVVNGQDGNDTLMAGSGSDTINGGDGNDKIIGSSGTHDSTGALAESDYYSGGAGNDTIIGGDGNDHIYGNAITAVAGAVDGADSLSGGSGNDYIQGNAGADTIDGGDGNDRIYGGADADSITGGTGNDYLQGNRGNDTLDGGDGNDTIHGGADNDSLIGGDGNDSLFGDAGIDTMTGGAGSDIFVFNGTNAAFTTTGTAAFAADEITDFTSGSDKIALDFHPEMLLAGTATSVSAAVTAATQLLQAHVGQDDVAAVTVGNDTYLFYDSTGLGGALDSAIKLDGVHGSLALTDFV